MATTSYSDSNLSNPYIPKNLCQIVGFACLAGFIVDLLVLAVPPNPMSVEWRVSIFQQMSDRSVILLFGIALTLYGSLDNPRVKQPISLASLLLGVFFSLCCILVIHDGITLQQGAINTINNQAAQVQTQIQQAQTNPPPNLKATPDQLKLASKQVKTQADTLTQTTRTTTIKTTFGSVGNLLAVGVGLISLGRYGSRVRRP